MLLPSALHVQPLSNKTLRIRANNLQARVSADYHCRRQAGRVHGLPTLDQAAACRDGVAWQLRWPPQATAAELRGLKRDLVLCAIMGAGNDYLPSVPGGGLTPRLGRPSLWACYLGLRAQPGWRHGWAMSRIVPVHSQDIAWSLHKHRVVGVGGSCNTLGQRDETHRHLWLEHGVSYMNVSVRDAKSKPD